MRSQISLFVLAAALVPLASHAAPFTYLRAGYAQEVFAVAPGATSFAFASDGDLWAVQGNAMVRYDAQTTITKNGTLIHPAVTTVSLGTIRTAIANHPD